MELNCQYKGKACSVLKAYDKAGLFSTSTSWAFMVETSPPSPGIVYDGPEENQYHDADYIISTDLYEVHWTDFVDPHTTVKEYYVSVGSCRDCDDIVTLQSVGITSGS